MTAIGRPLQKPVPIAGQPIAVLLDNLKSPVDGIRHRTRIELSGATPRRSSPPQRRGSRNSIRKKEDAHHLLEALWLHQQHNVKDFQLLQQVLNSPEPHARIAAKTVKHFWMDVDKTYRGGKIAGEVLASSQKSGILSDTPELTTISVGTVPEKMKYDVQELSVTPGKKVKLTFANYDSCRTTLCSSIPVRPTKSGWRPSSSVPGALMWGLCRRARRSSGTAN